MAVVTVTQEQFTHMASGLRTCPASRITPQRWRERAGARHSWRFPDGRTRVILRASGDVAVEVIAKAMGGGGHAFAAAAVVEGDIAETLGLLTETCCPYFAPDLPTASHPPPTEPSPLPDACHSPTRAARCESRAPPS